MSKMSVRMLNSNSRSPNLIHNGLRSQQESTMLSINFDEKVKRFPNLRK